MRDKPYYLGNLCKGFQHPVMIILLDYYSSSDDISILVIGISIAMVNTRDSNILKLGFVKKSTFQYVVALS